MKAAPAPLTEAVARNLYKLMAYKDEYEVARLAVDPRLAAELEAEFGAGARYVHHMQPPLLRALGLRRKIRLGRWSRPALHVLHVMRRLRGTALDPFGYTRLRRVERQLVTEYQQAILAALSNRPADDPDLLELAQLPDTVRGYEQIKLASVDAYRERQRELLAALASSPPAAVPAHSSAA